MVRIVSDKESLPTAWAQGPALGESLPAGAEVMLMWQTRERRHSWRRALYSLGLCSAVGIAGCQVDIGGQTLPSPHYQKDDVQYFPPGPEFKLSREAAAQKAFEENQAAEEQ